MTRTVARPCPGCREADNRTMGQVRGFSVEACRRCGTIFTAQLPTSEESTDYGAYYHAGNLEVPDFVRRRLVQLVVDFEADRQLNRWLDVGCGAGTLMRAAQGQGWDVVGTEVAERAASEMRAGGLDVRSGELDQLDLPEAGFDVVSMIEVVEHVVDVSALLNASVRVLRSGGALYVTTPHALGLSSRLLGTRWSVVSPPEHLQLFSIRGLRELLERSGFSDRSVRTTGGNPGELIRAARFRGRAAEPFRRVDSAYYLNESLSGSQAGTILKRAANSVLNATLLGDTIKVVAERAA